MMWIVPLAAAMGWVALVVLKYREIRRWRRLNDALSTLCLDSLKIQHWPHVEILAARHPDALMRVHVDYAWPKDCG